MQDAVISEYRETKARTCQQQFAVDCAKDKTLLSVCPLLGVATTGHVRARQLCRWVDCETLGSKEQLEEEGRTSRYAGADNSSRMYSPLPCCYLASLS